MLSGTRGKCVPVCDNCDNRRCELGNDLVSDVACHHSSHKVLKCSAQLKIFIGRDTSKTEGVHAVELLLRRYQKRALAAKHQKKLANCEQN